jgi:acetylornithine/succinyldiaminopimelate/putrescine aminotransferase
MGCAAGMEVIDQFTNDDLINRANSIGDIIKFHLKNVCELRGRGAIWAIILNDKASADKLVLACRDLSLLVVHTKQHTVKICPPLNIHMDLLTKGLLRMKKALK